MYTWILRSYTLGVVGGGGLEAPCRGKENELTVCIGALVNSSLPTVLVATKCDNPESSRQIDTEAVGTACQSCLATFKTSSSKPETARMSLFTLLKALVLNRQGQ